LTKGLIPQVKGKKTKKQIDSLTKNMVAYVGLRKSAEIDEPNLVV